MAALRTERLAATVGARVDGVDLDRFLYDEELPEQTLAALEEHGALVFPGLHLDDKAQVEFSRKLGQVEKLGRGEFPEIFRVTLDPSINPAAAYLRGTFYWHIDGCTDEIPIMATMLSAHAVADQGGETEFASTYQAYDDLTADEKARFSNLRVLHSVEASMRLHVPDPKPEQVELWRKRPGKEQPLVWTHQSGRKSLVIGATADHVVGMDVDDGRALLAALLERATVPGRVYRHTWRVGDVVMWDNRGVLHRAAPYDPASPRDMHRTTFAGNEPIQ
ncbi:MAG TPA: TauD/TfdA family dioxygenase [Acidimicrobiales bacterium]|nr:TauD/TfdA family dioxygenase [Acidimicrobiales bacterium]